MNRHVARSVHIQDDTYGMHTSMLRVSVVTSLAFRAPAVGESTKIKPRLHLDRHLHVSGFRKKEGTACGILKFATQKPMCLVRIYCDLSLW
jgi:hypothetical protein